MQIQTVATFTTPFTAEEAVVLDNRQGSQLRVRDRQVSCRYFGSHTPVFICVCVCSVNTVAATTSHHCNRFPRRCRQQCLISRFIPHAFEMGVGLGSVVGQSPQLKRVGPGTPLNHKTTDLCL